MTTQTVMACLYGPQSGRRFSVTATDAVMNEITSETGTLSLYKVLRGKTITHVSGQYAAGIAIGQIRNTQTNQIKAIFPLDIIGEERYRRLDAPVTIQENDILETYVDVA